MRHQQTTHRTGARAIAPRTIGFIAAAFAALVFVFAAGSAHAGGYKNKHHGKHHGHYQNHGKRKNNTVVIFGSSGYSAFSYPAYPRRQHYYITDAPVCRVVSKIGYWYGRKAEIGGTACPDGFGNLTVINGSHHLIRYLF